MARFDHGGGCACGLQKECDCSAKELSDVKELKMAELRLELNLGELVHPAMIQGLVDLVNAFPRYRMAVILALLRDDPISRCMIAEELGEQAYRERDEDASAQRRLDQGDDSAEVADKSWDQIMLEVLDRLQDTPGGKGLVA